MKEKTKEFRSESTGPTQSFLNMVYRTWPIESPGLPYEVFWERCFEEGHIKEDVDKSAE